MLSRSSISVDWPVVVNAALVEEVVKACGCRKDMAVALLQPHTPTDSEAAFSADQSSPRRTPESFVDLNNGQEDTGSLEEPDFARTPPSFNLSAPTSTEANSRSLSSVGGPVSVIDDLSSLQLSDASPDETGEILAICGQPGLNDPVVSNQAGGIGGWDFVLPRVAYTNHPNPTLDNTGETFDIREVVAAVQDGASLQTVRIYVERYGRRTVRKTINDEVEGFPAIFYVAQSNNEPLLRLWINYGGNPEAVHAPSKIPLLAFAVITSEHIQTDTTLITSTLLSLGASPSVIPSAYYVPYLEDLPAAGRDESRNQEVNHSDDSDVTQWCTGFARSKLVRTLTLSQRYYLEKASKMKRPSQRHIQLAQRRNAEALLGLPYLLIGQALASNLLLQQLLSHLISPSKRPLVLVFAGPSGHGKTELARKLGHLLSLELQVVDCSIYNEEKELFGPREPWVGSEKGSPLNNFLARNTGKRCIVFLDEFEKTNHRLHDKLLLPFENGEYEDRRDRSTVDCSKTVWILATNAHDAIIQEFCSAHHEALFGDNGDAEKSRLAKSLSAEIKQDFLIRFGPPITGRISAFIPFLRFSLGEQAVVVHKYLLELGESVKGPVNLSFGPREKLLGDVRVRIRRNASFCQFVAKAEYHADLGARSLINAVDTIKGLLVEAYLEIDEQIVESTNKATFLLDVQDGEIVVKVMGS